MGGIVQVPDWLDQIRLAVSHKGMLLALGNINCVVGSIIH